MLKLSQFVTPDHVAKRMAALDMSQSVLAHLTTIDPGRVSRFLRGQRGVLTESHIVDIHTILRECELFNSLFEPISINFHSPEKAEANLKVFREYFEALPQSEQEILFQSSLDQVKDRFGDLVIWARKLSDGKS